MLHYDPQQVSSSTLLKKHIVDRSVTYILLKNKGIVH